MSEKFGELLVLLIAATDMPQMRAVSAFAAPAKGRFVRMPTFEPTKCRALH